jgi:probable H4MPT-linked C1 transfer pathway protein
MSTAIGWDIGGVHLKAARADNGRVVDAIQVASPLRLGLERLAQAFSDAKARIGSADHHIVTMTGELADTFSCRVEGVATLTEIAMRQLAPRRLSLYAGRVGFIAPDDARDHVEDIASANWFASASLIARIKDAALLVDIGSTTTDLVPVAGGNVVARGYTDVERLAAGELVYTGLVRSFLMAVGGCVPWRGSWSPLINENFATMADVHRVLGTLPDDADHMTTADGRPKTLEASRARLARMVGCDAADANDAAWTALAQWFAERQIRLMMDGAMQVISAGGLTDDTPIVGAGIGEAVARELARRLGRDYASFDSMLAIATPARKWASRCAPAAALAVLATTS